MLLEKSSLYLASVRKFQPEDYEDLAIRCNA